MSGEVGSSMGSGSAVSQFQHRDAGLMTSNQINALLAKNGINPKKSPFMAFFFLVSYVLGVVKNGKENASIKRLASEIDSMSSDLNLYEAIKQEFYKSKGSDNTLQFRSAIKAFLNQITSNCSPGLRYLIKPTKNGCINGAFFGVFVGILEKNQARGDTSWFNKNFPVLGENVVGLFKGLYKMTDYFTNEPGRAAKDLEGLWSQADGKSGSNPYNLPDPECIRPMVDALSEGSSTLRGISASEGSKLQYVENQHNKLWSLIKNLLNQWQMQRKACINGLMQSQ